ncbi:hypothetical protein CANCADRAFT_3257 [Tortispora caseinolytica NRRL Y-17796]|uniref:NADPH-dependent diflavin oxidoreductase 1 n=1 Tax=Tortispora caseinolytica NRRL Y-17796 TaxID=767744 RepID=A0A1E4TA34_9ASCO|nr:hypothetical protein CANCADRAFT_3257 [Tortispora caseinolytica NRRL Y-17796]
MILIVYGSETGNSADLAMQLDRKLRRNGIRCKLGSLDHLGPDLKSASIAIFIISTTGQGVLPRNCRQFWSHLLRKSLPGDYLANLKFASFGLGDSSYIKYNYAVKKLHARLLQLGAHQFGDRAEADEQDNPQMTFEYWAESLLECMPCIDPKPRHSSDSLLAPRYPLTVCTDKPRRLAPDAAYSRPLPVATVCANKRITDPTHFQDVRLISLEQQSTDHTTVQPGDSCTIYPENDPALVQTLLDLQHWSDIADYPVDIDPEYWHDTQPVRPLTLRSLIAHHLDIMSIPRQSFFEVAKYFSDPKDSEDGREREKLEDFSSIEGQDELHNYANRPRRSILETISEFSSLKIPVEYLLELIPPLRPRLFSISSIGPHLELIVGLVKYRTILRRVRKGVCSDYFTRLQVGTKINYSIVKSPFRLPSPEKPIVMIAPGTGVAPMRCLIQYRFHLNDTVPVGENVIIFGCRYHDKDYFLKDEWNRLLEHKNFPFKVVTAFSREEPKQYVQNALHMHGDRIAELILDQNASVYLCGSSGAMPRQVRDTLVEIFSRNDRMTHEEASEYLYKMERMSRYIQDTW